MASAFDFSDDYGSDPIMRRYRRVGSSDVRTADAELRGAAAERQLAEAKAARVQAELDAQLMPMKTTVDTITNISNLVKTQKTLEEEAQVRRGATALTEGLGNVKDLPEWNGLVSNNASGLRDPEVGTKARMVGLGLFTSITDNASTPYEVDRAYSQLPAAIATEPEFKTAYDNARRMAEKRENIATTMAERGMGPVPTTDQGDIDVQRAAVNVATDTGVRNTRSQAVENIKLLQDQVGVLNKQIEQAGGVPNDVQQLRLESLQNMIEENMGVINFRPTTATSDVPTPSAGALGEQPEADQNDAIGALLPTQAAAAVTPTAVAAVTDAQIDTTPSSQLTREQLEARALELGFKLVNSDTATAGQPQSQLTRSQLASGGVPEFSVQDKNFKPNVSDNVSVEDEIQRAIESLYEDKSVLGLRFGKRKPSNMSGGMDRVDDVGAAKFLSQQDPALIASIYEKLNRLQGSGARAFRTSDGGWSTRVDSPEQLLSRIQQLSKNPK